MAMNHGISKEIMTWAEYLIDPQLTFRMIDGLSTLAHKQECLVFGGERQMELC